jgi:hypothetical protein
MANRDAGVARVAARRYWRSADARVVVDAWRRSGEGLRMFAECYGIDPHRLRRWARDLDERAEPVRFHAVRVVQGSEVERVDRASLEIELGEGWTVRVGPGFAAADLARVLEVLGVGTRC